MNRGGQVWEWVSEFCDTVDTHIVLWEMSDEEVERNNIAKIRCDLWWMTLNVDTGELLAVSETALDEEYCDDDDHMSIIYRMVGKWKRVA